MNLDYPIPHVVQDSKWVLFGNFHIRNNIIGLWLIFVIKVYLFLVGLFCVLLHSDYLISATTGSLYIVSIINLILNGFYIIHAFVLTIIYYIYRIKIIRYSFIKTIVVMLVIYFSVYPVSTILYFIDIISSTSIPSIIRVMYLSYIIILITIMVITIVYFIYSFRINTGEENKETEGTGSQV